jgi:UDP-glucose 4-epimerase
LKTGNFPKKVLITGGLGYLGSHTIVALHQAGYEVVSADNHSNSQPDVAERIAKITGIKPKNYVIDVCERAPLQQLFAEEGPFDGVIHMAAFKSVAESVENPHKYYHNNLVSLLQVLHCCQQFGVQHLVFSSTCTVYGEPKVLPVTEDTPLNPLSPYGKTKAIGEEIIRDFVGANAMQAIALRFFNPVGAHPSAEIGEFPQGIPSNLLPHMAQTAAGMHPYLRIWGADYPTADGTCIRDFIHVCDLAEVHVKALDYLLERAPSQALEVMNIGTGKGVSVKQMHAAFEKVNKVEVPYKVFEHRAGDIISMYADNTKAHQLLDWTPRYGLNDMVETAWQWQQALANWEPNYSNE